MQRSVDAVLGCAEAGEIECWAFGMRAMAALGVARWLHEVVKNEGVTMTLYS